MIQAILFILITLLASYYAFIKYAEIYKAIQLGYGSFDKSNFAVRLKNMLYFALAQKKMFDRPVAGIFHLFIYLAFVLTQIEAIEIFVDGISGHHRSFASTLGTLYTIVINLIELLSILAFVATLVFLYRRNLLKLPRFQSKEMLGWPFKDANLILFAEIVLIVCIISMNGAYQQLQLHLPQIYPDGGNYFVSQALTQSLFSSFSVSNLQLIERFFWWAHYLIVLGFVVYLPYSKHLHIFLAFPSSYYSDLEERGKMNTIKEIETEVRSMLSLPSSELSNPRDYFGASDVHHLNKNVLLQAFSCTECGRCTSVCPAHLTGKKLSPRKIVMDIRDRCEEIIQHKVWEKNPETSEIDITDGKSLLDVISKEELYACTSCNACVEACPVLINPLKPILELRRYDILMNSGGPAEWLPMFNSLENNSSVWSLANSRTQWTEN